MPVGFWCDKALINMWCSLPLWYIAESQRAAESSLRYINLAVLVIVAIVGIMVFPPSCQLTSASSHVFHVLACRWLWICSSELSGS